jgi:hypothetical protein
VDGTIEAPTQALGLAAEQTAACVQHPPASDEEAMAWAADLRRLAAQLEHVMSVRAGIDFDLTDELARGLANRIDRSLPAVGAQTLQTTRTILLVGVPHRLPTFSPPARADLAAAAEETLAVVDAMIAWLEDLEDLYESVVALADERPRVPHARALAG